RDRDLDPDRELTSASGRARRGNQGDPAVAGFADGGFVVAGATAVQPAAMPADRPCACSCSVPTARGSAARRWSTRPPPTTSTGRRSRCWATAALPSSGSMPAIPPSNAPGVIHARLFSTEGAATDGDDVLTGTAGRDTIDALGGHDTVRGGAGNDTLDGGAESDTLVGGAGRDRLTGGDGNDSLAGNAGNDRLI